MKKVLFIAYYFPPLGWSGVQRPLKFAKYLKNFGWKPTIVTVNAARFPIKDETLLEELDGDLEIIRIDGFEIEKYLETVKEKLLKILSPQETVLYGKIFHEYVKKIDKKLSELEEIIYIPDALNLWVYNVLENIEELVDMRDVEMIFTTSPPHSITVLGFNLKQRYKIPWVCDFRDEWTNHPYSNYDTKSKEYIIQRCMEESTVFYADKVITTTPIATQNLIDTFEANPSKFITITNGYDEEDFVDICKKERNDKFTIVYNGSFYDQIVPYTVILAINNLISQGKMDVDDIEIQFIGTCTNVIKEKIINYDGYKIVKYLKYMPHKDSIKKAVNADLLLLIVGNDMRLKAVYTSKIFEYLRLKIPVLALSPAGSVVEELLSRTGSGVNIQFGDVSRIEQHISLLYDLWRRGMNGGFIPNEAEINKYERKKLTAELAKIFDEIVEKKGKRS